MPEAVDENRLATFRTAYNTLDRLQDLAPRERQPAIEETMDELQRQIGELEADVKGADA